MSPGSHFSSSFVGASNMVFNSRKGWCKFRRTQLQSDSVNLPLDLASRWG